MEMAPFLYLLKTHLSTCQWQTRQPKHIETLHTTHESSSEAALILSVSLDGNQHLSQTVHFTLLKVMMMYY